MSATPSGLSTFMATLFIYYEKYSIDMSENDTTIAFVEKLKADFGFDIDEIVVATESVNESKPNSDLTKCLATSSKNGKGKAPGRPDILVYDIPGEPRLIFLVEVKPTKSRHQGPNHVRFPNIIERQKQHPKDIVDYAVDGVMWYMHHCRERFSIIGLAVSGTDDEVQSGSYSIATFFQRQSKMEGDLLKHYDIVPMTYNNPAQSPINEVITLQDYIDAAMYDPQYLVDATRDIDEIKEQLKPITRLYKPTDKRALTLSSLLVALQDEECQNYFLRPAGSKEEHVEAIIQAYEREMARGGEEE